MQVVGKQIDIPVFADETPGANPVDIARRAVGSKGTHMLKDVVIIDTVGRLAIDEVLMDSYPILNLLFDLMKFYSL